MTSCRGILIAGLTNRSRTQMAEGLLRHLTSGKVFIVSGGVRHHGAIHPYAIQAMQDIGVDLSGQSVTTLESAYRQRFTYDIYVSIDAPYCNRRSDRYQRMQRVTEEEDDDGKDLYGDPMLAAATPSHWGTNLDAADARQRWELWSPRDPTVFCEKSTRKFQDHLYEGEPLFMRLEVSPLRKAARVSERWEVPEISERYAMEREAEVWRRFTDARESIATHCIRLLRRLEVYYGEVMLTDPRSLHHLAAHSEAVRTALANETTSS